MRSYRSGCDAGTKRCRRACRNRAPSLADNESNFFVISDLTPLSEVLAIFKQATSHLMIAASFRDAESGAVLTPVEMAAWVSSSTGAGRPGPFTSTFTGVITLEDVIEEVIDHEIVDEHDRYKSNDTKDVNDKARRRGLPCRPAATCTRPSACTHVLYRR